MAVSPGFVFYGRYAIHEVWLQFFSMMFILGLLGLWKSGRVNYLWYAGMGTAGMILTKETYAIHLACAVIAIPVLMASYALSRVPDAKPVKQTWTYIDLAMVLGVRAAAIVFFCSGMCLSWNGFTGLYQGVKAWSRVDRACPCPKKPTVHWLKC